MPWATAVLSHISVFYMDLKVLVAVERSYVFSGYIEGFFSLQTRLQAQGAGLSYQQACEMEGSKLFKVVEITD